MTVIVKMVHKLGQIIIILQQGFHYGLFFTFLIQTHPHTPNNTQTQYQHPLTHTLSPTDPQTQQILCKSNDFQSSQKYLNIVDAPTMSQAFL